MKHKTIYASFQKDNQANKLKDNLLNTSFEAHFYLAARFFIPDT